MTLRRQRFLKCALLLIAAGALLRLLRIGMALEYDEIWTLENYAAASLKTIFSELSLPNNHPLNSLAVKLTAFPGSAPQWIRTVPYLLGVLAIPLAGVVGFGLWRRRSAALWSMFFIAVLPQAVFYSQQARGYSFQLFFLLLFTAGLFAARRHPAAGCTAIFLGAAGAMLTLPTSAFYLAAVGIAALFRCRKEWRSRLSAGIVLAVAGTGCLMWVAVNLTQFQANRSWGTPIGSVSGFVSFLKPVVALNLPVIVLLGTVPALLLGFRRTLPVLWVWACLLLAAIAFNGGPPRTYLPLAAATALAAGFGVDLLCRRFPVRRKIIIAFFGIFALLALANAYREPVPDWYAMEEETEKLPPEITVIYPATDTYPLAWNNTPAAYREQIRRIAPLPPGHAARKLLVVSRNGMLSGCAANGAQCDIPLSIPGVLGEFDAMQSRLYGLEKLNGSPAEGDAVVAFIRPLLQQEARELLQMLLSTQKFYLFNIWLCTSVTQNGKVYRYYLVGGRVANPEKTDWNGFLLKRPGATALFRIAPLGKSR